MLKKALLHPPDPRRAKTCLFPSYVLGSEKSSTYRTMGKEPVSAGSGLGG